MKKMCYLRGLRNYLGCFLALFPARFGLVLGKPKKTLRKSLQILSQFLHLTAFLLALFTFSTSQAVCNYGGRCCPSDFEIGFDILIWKPCVEDLKVCAKINAEVVDEVETYSLAFNEICPDWEGGVRVWLYYPDLICWCNMGIKSSYTFLDHSQNAAGFSKEQMCLMLPPNLVAEGLLENIKSNSKYESRYHEFDALLYFDCACGECYSLEPCFGLAFLYIKQKLEVDYELTEDSTAATADMQWKTEAGGIGLRIGMTYRYYYSRCLSYYAFGQGTLLASRQDGKQTHSFRGATDVDVKIDTNECWGCIPGFHLGAGMIYDFCICDFDLSFWLGYEFREWFGLRKHRRFFGDDLETELDQTSQDRRSIGFHGVNVGLGWCF